MKENKTFILDLNNYQHENNITVNDSYNNNGNVVGKILKINFPNYLIEKFNFLKGKFKLN
jgi:hypothetical protein